MSKLELKDWDVCLCMGTIKPKICVYREFDGEHKFCSGYMAARDYFGCTIQYPIIKLGEIPEKWRTK